MMINSFPNKKIKNLCPSKTSGKDSQPGYPSPVAFENSSPGQKIKPANPTGSGACCLW
jgi:hypothetical protein